MKKYIILFIFIISVIFTNNVFASSTNGTIDPVHNYAWSSYLGWFNFNADQGNIHITDSELTGYIWTQNYGWVNLSPTDSGVKNDGEGHLSGFAWGENLGWGDFSHVTIDANGIFHGSVLNLNLNAQSLSFDCDNCSVWTDWRPLNVRNPVVVTPPISSGGSSTGSYIPVVIPITPPVIIPEIITPPLPINSVPVVFQNPVLPHSGFAPKSKIIIKNTIPVISKKEILIYPRFKIPVLKINSKIESVGLTPAGAMDSPAGPVNVGWFSLGTKIGEKGSAVIDGHSGYKNNVQAVFDNLYKLKKGDKIYVVDEKGKTITFVVRELKLYKPNQDATNIFISNDNLSHLNLITCTGKWDSVAKSHSQRLVVFTDREI